MTINNQNIKICITASNVDNGKLIHKTTTTLDEAMKHLGEGKDIWEVLLRNRGSHFHRRRRWMPGLIVDIEYRIA